MGSTTHQRAMDLLADLLELPADEREAYLDRVCDGDVAVRNEVERLLSFERSSQAARLTSAHQLIASTFQTPTQIGQYRVRRVLGEGGMGVVYEAEQISPRRRVAVKVIRSGLGHPVMRRRFEYEAQVLAKLEHPGIARLYEAHACSEPNAAPAYLAMEFVDGQPIDEYCRENDLTTSDKLRLVIRVCEAVAHAHRMGVIHRDLKPPNILVERDGSPKVLDFGVAKMIHSERDTTLLTDAGQLIGTINYMSPERVDSSHALDTRSDVYSLGVILYQLLCGKLPIDVSGAGLLTAARRICGETPRPLGTVDRSLRGDIEVVITRALEKDVARRYPSVEAFAADLQRILEGRPVEARSRSRIYVIRTTAWRWRYTIATAAAALAVLCVFAGYSWMLARANAQKSEALRRLLYVSNVGFAHAAMNNNEAPRARRLLDDCPIDLRGWEWKYLNAMSDQSLRAQTLPCDLPRYAHWSADRRKIVISSMAREVLLVDKETGAIEYQAKVGAGTARAAISPDGRRLAYGGSAEEIQLVELETREVRQITTAPTSGASAVARGLRGLCFSPDGTLLAAANGRGRVLLFDVQTLALLSEFDVGPREPQSFLFTADGKSLVIGNDAGTLRRHDARTGAVEMEYRAHTAAVGTIELSADGQTLISGDFVGYVNLWSLHTGELQTQIRMEDQWITSVGLSADGKTLVVGRADAGLFLYDVASRHPICQLRGHVRGVIRAWFDGDRIVTIGLDSQMRLWLADPNLNATRINTGQQQTLGVGFMPDGGSFFTAGTTGVVYRWDVHTLKPLQAYEGHTETSYYVAVDRAGRRLASAGRDQTLRVWDIASGRPVRTMIIDRGPVNAVAITPDGRYVLSGDVGGGIRQWDVESGQLVRTWNTGGRVVYSLSFHPDGVHFASGSGDGRLMLWSLEHPSELAAVQADRQLVYEVRFSPDGTRIGCVGANASVRLYEIEEWNRLRQIGDFVGHVGAVTGFAYAPDGRRIASSGADRTIRVWDIDSQTELLGLRGHGSLIQRLAFSPDGNTLVSTSDDGTARVWAGSGR